MIENIDTLLQNPYIVTGIALVVIVAYHYIKQMPYSEFVFVTQAKHRLFLLLQPLAQQRGLRLVKTKGYRENEDEYIVTVDKSPKELAKQFKEHNINQHLIAGSKRRKMPNGSFQWAHTHWAYQHDTGKQSEFWLYTNPDGTTDIQGHHEDSVFDPDGHLTTPYTPGDPKGVLNPVLE
jgi:hypothetical protein